MTVPIGAPGLDPAWSRFLTVPDAGGTGHRWHVLDNGVRDPRGTLLCVHGNPTWSYLWRRLLRSGPPGWRVVAPDQLGMGWSERLTGPRSLQQRVADLGDLTAALGVTGPVVTVGHDWGGVISLGWALEHRADLCGVVLTNTAVAMPAGDRGPALIRAAHLPGVRAAVTVGTPVFVRAASSLSRPPLPAAVRDALAAPYRSAARRTSVGDFVADIPFAPGHPSRPVQEAIAEGIRGLDVPALLLWGPRDPVFGERYLVDLRSRLPRAQLHRYEGASHLLPEDAPQYAEAVTRWVADLTAGPGPAAPPRTTAAGGTAGRRLWSALADRSGDDSPAVVAPGGSTVSWAQLARRVEQLAAGLAAAGVRPGARVALLVEPSPDLTAAVYAVWRAGAVIVVADKGLGFPGMRRALRGAAVDHVIGSAAGLVAARLMGLAGTRVAAGRIGSAARRALGARHTLGELEVLGRAAPVPAAPPEDADCAVLFTSGATGPAKGVVYTSAQAQAQVELVRSTYGLTAADRLVAAFAPFALLGPALGIGSAVPDVDVTAPGTLTAAALADAAAAVDATVVFASPAALRRVAATAGALTAGQRRALGAVRLLVSAGAPVPAPVLWSLRPVLPAAEAHTPYGMTEALPVTDVSLAGIEAAGTGDGVCVGRPLTGVEVQVSPLSAGAVADGPLTGRPGVSGEVCVRAAHVKDRYDALWATERAASDPPGWHRTGDVGYLDAEGRLWIEGRLAHVVTTAAGPVTPVGIEQRVEELDGVAAAAAVGVGPAGAQVLVVVVVPAGAGRRPGLRGRPALAGTGLADAVRDVARVDVAAVLVAAALPVDIRHQSKVDRRAVAEQAARVLAGARTRRRARPGRP
ncbi:alpha/beta fold hydrolase [Geodermatophilus sabuli]|uniref:Acyl-CoA synthetase (AMP-forming)/AMP-acid ligase II n=1 Tax=Geodermatophilus sabuli TaxID=1564158 RepID=A0A285EBH3_9ACTN|nr:alpha/beta fold hydrolase [Geodermatophilus sabuli]MBB3084335.1 acyl-coenzyme A synthetase/AMP-(fatty) acid ligase/pimeloyl-ACP methyl ester carboxylesterase [Geodermatophilus sabuli]SNX96395.1 Acyl-CoA synthetase (AMP-forming)/AMP-acid ligase II [Geodermatophilus sabuli]